MLTIKINTELTKEEIEDTLAFISVMKKTLRKKEKETEEVLKEELQKSQSSLKDIQIQMINVTLLQSAIDTALRKLRSGN